MKLFLGNASKQRHAFTFNPPDADDGQNKRARPPITQFIQPLHIEPLSGDWTKAQLEAIIDQHRAYGFIDISEIDRTKAFTGMCYAVDKSFSRERLVELMTANLVALDKRGREMRELAAVAANNSIERDMQEHGMPGKLSTMEFEVEEVRSVHSNTEETVPQRVRVTREEGEGGHAPRGRGRRAA